MAQSTSMIQERGLAQTSEQSIHVVSGCSVVSHPSCFLSYECADARGLVPSLVLSGSVHLCQILANINHKQAHFGHMQDQTQMSGFVLLIDRCGMHWQNCPRRKLHFCYWRADFSRFTALSLCHRKCGFMMCGHNSSRFQDIFYCPGTQHDRCFQVVYRQSSVL